MGGYCFAPALEFDTMASYLIAMPKSLTSRTRNAALGGAAVTIRKNARASKVTFGDVTVQALRPAKAVVAANIQSSSEALERLASAITKPGVYLRRKKGVPSYFADADEAGVFWRRLNGRVQRGRFVNGRFEVG